MINGTQDMCNISLLRWEISQNVGFCTKIAFENDCCWIMWAERPNWRCLPISQRLPSRCPLEHLVRMLQWSSFCKEIYLAWQLFSGLGRCVCVSVCVFVLLCCQFWVAQARTLQSINIINTVLFPFSRIFWSDSSLLMSIKARQQIHALWRRQHTMRRWCSH